jgi:hypothetical protein
VLVFSLNMELKFIYLNYDQVCFDNLNSFFINDRLYLDIRTQKVVRGRSINMALSCRGRAALAYIDCEDLIVQNGIAMRARMLHDLQCQKQAVPYGTRPDHVKLKIYPSIRFFSRYIFSKLYPLIVVF